MENLTLDPRRMFEELAELARAEGVVDQGAWDELAEGLLENKRRWQEIDDDEDVEGVLEELKSRFDDFAATIDIM